jgi:hypothetical protein
LKKIKKKQKMSSRPRRAFIPPEPQLEEAALAELVEYGNDSMFLSQSTNEVTKEVRLVGDGKDTFLWIGDRRLFLLNRTDMHLWDYYINEETRDDPALKKECYRAMKSYLQRKIKQFEDTYGV